MNIKDYFNKKRSRLASPGDFERVANDLYEQQGGTDEAWEQYLVDIVKRQIEIVEKLSELKGADQLEFHVSIVDKRELNV